MSPSFQCQPACYIDFHEWNAHMQKKKEFIHDGQANAFDYSNHLLAAPQLNEQSNLYECWMYTCILQIYIYFIVRTQWRIGNKKKANRLGPLTSHGGGFTFSLSLFLMKAMNENP